MDPKDKGKRKLIQPRQTKKTSSSMETCTEINRADKLMQSSMKALNSLQTEMINSQQSTPGLEDIKIFQSQIPTVYPNPHLRIRPQFQQYKNTQGRQFETTTPSYVSQSKQPTDSIFFGNYAFQKCTDINRKFRPLVGVELTEKQQCLVDNLWHVQTMPNAASFKVQILNALSIYFSEQTIKQSQQQQKKFTHYVIFRGSKLGIFNKWETVVQHIQVPKPLYKGFYSFTDALTAARNQFGLKNYFIEPEEVKSFSEMAKIHPEQIIKAQEETIANLQKQLLEQKTDAEFSQCKIENKVLKEKEKILLEKLEVLQKKLEEKEKETNTFIYRDFDSFKARLLDIPFQETLKPLIEEFSEAKQIIADKVRREFPLILFDLQLEILDIAFKEKHYNGVKVVQSYRNEEVSYMLLQINYDQTSMTDDQIATFYHYGMIDYFEFKYSRRVELFLNKLGVKILLTAGNIATQSMEIVGCKILSSFPEMDNHIYRPARKRIFVSEIPENRQRLKQANCSSNIEIEWWQYRLDEIINSNPQEQITLARKWIAEGQKTPLVNKSIILHPRISPYKLLAEGHYIQIWGHSHWQMTLPFVGESEQINIWDIINTEEVNYEDNEDVHSPVSFDSTHRDF